LCAQFLMLFCLHSFFWYYHYQHNNCTSVVKTCYSRVLTSCSPVFASFITPLVLMQACVPWLLQTSCFIVPVSRQCHSVHGTHK
jgi:hypothetical protein